MIDTRPNIVVDWQFFTDDKEEIRRIEEERARQEEEIQKFRRATERHEGAVYSSDVTERRLTNSMDVSQRVR